MKSKKSSYTQLCQACNTKRQDTARVGKQPETPIRKPQGLKTWKKGPAQMERASASILAADRRTQWRRNRLKTIDEKVSRTEKSIAAMSAKLKMQMRQRQLARRQYEKAKTKLRAARALADRIAATLEPEYA